MNSKFLIYLFVILSFFGLTACAQVGPVNSQESDGRSAKTYQEHNGLASYYDGVAKEMSDKAVQKKELLGDYEVHSYYYGRGGQDFKSHTEANLRYYEEAARDAVRKADFHRRIAAELLKREYAKPDEASDPTVARKVKLNSAPVNLN